MSFAQFACLIGLALVVVFVWLLIELHKDRQDAKQYVASTAPKRERMPPRIEP
ncbi:MAG: hypothetical protein ACREPQ_09675 [Rhodanobacter sp.]